MITEETIKEVWEKAGTVDGFAPSMYRRDACGALIMRDKYGIRGRDMMSMHSHCDHDDDFDDMQYHDGDY